MLLRGGLFSASHAVVGDSHGNCRFPGVICPPTGKFVAVSCCRPRRSHALLVSSVASGEVKRKPQTSLTHQLRHSTLSEDGSTYNEKFIVRSYEVGINKTATIETIANFLQEVGCNHAQSVGYSTDGFSTTFTMRKLCLIWVTTRMHIEIYKYPAWHDVVEVETFGHIDSIANYRDWILKDHATGEVIGRATSKWVMMNQDTRRLQRFTDETRDEYLRYVTSRLAFPEENNASMTKIAKLDDPAQHSKIGLVPRRADLDMNQHINNVTYIGWALESMPQEIMDSHELQAITLDFRRECHQDDAADSLMSLYTVSRSQGTTDASPSTAEDENGYLQFLHLVRLSKNGFEINRGRTVWRKKPARSNSCYSGYIK
ncbi:hypothetical protein ACS0TY_003009 [Phlomoides rotata]